MPIAIATTMLWAAGLYAGAGVAFALAFVIRGVSRVDPGAAGAPWSFRLLILPGAVALWPVLLGRWLRAAKGAHR